MVSFSDQKSQFWQILEGLIFKNVDIFYGHLGYLCNDHLVNVVFISLFFPVLVSCAKKNLATLVIDSFRALRQLKVSEH
jgi:hypothetical protein